MSFMDALKRSLGFEASEETSSNNLSSGNSYATEYYEDDIDDYEMDSDYLYYDDPTYEIMLLRPKNIDDINYIIDQIIEEKNPVIVDLAFLQKESPANFKLATDKIKYMRSNFGAEAFLLTKTEDKHLFIITPDNVRVVKK